MAAKPSCALELALVDVLSEMEEAGALKGEEKMAVLARMEKIFFRELREMGSGGDARPVRRGRAKVDDGLQVTAALDEYSSYMDTWDMKLRDVEIKVDGHLLNATCPIMHASFRRAERTTRKKMRKTKKDENDDGAPRSSLPSDG
ncbi:Aste57867_24069 [Aphanomyces stellatus]|uniref:Aste57867_24069 protein n=1 Tax=Aphanomyces stellatus TaxID=120398 RepID=A0A485LPI3_9STRA|nr:hypothetical protein As57867_023996 [Aphanomyces stellatus]VFU00712.1 Aste57867_24069 [Aphanomyces stellatus]